MWRDVSGECGEEVLGECGGCGERCWVNAEGVGRGVREV